MINLAHDGASGAVRASARKWRLLGLAAVYQLALGAVILALGYLFKVELPVRGSIPPAFALAIVGVLVPAASFYITFFHRFLDEQEERAYFWATCIAWYFMGLTGVCWFVLSEALLVGPVNFVGLFVAGSIVQLLAWFGFKFR